MPFLTLVLSAALAAGVAEAHVEPIDHRGTAYEVSYRPHLAARMKTIGSAVGPRSSGERCRWSIDVTVERIVRRSGDEVGHDTMLAPIQRIEGTRFGNCKAVRDIVLKEQAAKLGGQRDRLVEAARRDRGAAIAAIDAAHALAAN